ncbi:MAG: S8 family peptidase [Burkholderiaceae bacterium]|nr:S8 family peptidase [Burkholderiaceae bacterium]
MRLLPSIPRPVRALSALAALLPMALMLPAPGATAATQEPMARVIVKFKAGVDATSVAATTADQLSVRVQGVAHRLGVPMRAGIGISDRTQLLTATGLSSRQLAARLAQDSSVEYAVPDELRHRASAPNDPRYASGLGPPGPAGGQWYLRAPAGAVKSAMDIEGAWSTVATSSSTVVVAVLDTGIRFDHPDLKRAVDGGNLLDGYDFVTNSFIENDATPGRDGDPSDPGDWVSAADVASAANTVGCTTSDIEDSSWHGTQTAGLIGALTNNALGMAGLTGPGRALRVLPVRVLGKCGGFDSDIIPAMRWAAGLSVPGVPANPTPARVINLSLGGSGACSAAYQDAVREINQAGVVVVASAGNTSGHAVNTPANCTGVIGVGGLRHVGSKVGFSDLGPEIALSAPGGNCVNLTGECLYPLLTTTNAGVTAPVPANEAYTDASIPTIGTSFSAPLVAGTAALMLVAQPGLKPDDVRSLLRRSSRPFPTSGDSASVPVCQAPKTDSAGHPIDQLECYCTTSTCGAGMLDASAAVALAKSDDGKGGGGGALGFGWLLALGVAIRAVALTRAKA